MTQPDLSLQLNSLIATWENEVAEFKRECQKFRVQGGLRNYTEGLMNRS